MDKPPISQDDLTRHTYRQIARLAAKREAATSNKAANRLWQRERQLWAEDLKRRLRIAEQTP